MRILLVLAPISSKSYDVSSLVLMEPIALEYIGASVRKDHDVKLVDFRAEAETDLEELLNSFKPDIIGTGALTIEVNSVKQLFSRVKKIMPEILTVVGGQHATLIPQDFFEKYIDVVVVGEGTGPFKKICECYETQKSFEDIENIYYRKNGKMVFTRKEPFPGLDVLPLPDRTLTSHIRYKFKSSLLFNEPTGTACVRASVGCTFNCKFCSVINVMNRKVYRRNIDSIIEELESLDEPFIYWLDDEFLLDPKRAILLAKELDKAGIKKYHHFFARSDTIINHPECIEEWAKVGLILIYTGLESFREKDLKAMRKGTTISKNSEALRICHSNNVRVMANFIVYQDFDKQDFKNFAKFVRDLDIFKPSFSVLTPFPGTALYEENKEKLISRDYDLFDAFHTLLPTKLPLKQFYKEFSKLAFRKSMSLKKKLKLVKQMDSIMRKKVIANMKEIDLRIRNSYMEYDKSLW